MPDQGVQFSADAAQEDGNSISTRTPTGKAPSPAHTGVVYFGDDQEFPEDKHVKRAKTGY